MKGKGFWGLIFVYQYAEYPYFTDFSVIFAGIHSRFNSLARDITEACGLMNG